MTVVQVKRRMIRNNCETKISQNKLSTIRNREYSKQGRERNKSNLKYQISVTDSKRDYSRAQRSGEKGIRIQRKGSTSKEDVREKGAVK